MPLSRRARRLGAPLVLGVLIALPGPALSAPLKLAPAQERAMGLAFAQAAPATQAPLASLAASVTPPMNGRKIVAAPFAGMVMEVHVLEGQSVKAGAPLATLFSRDALAVSSELAQARAELNAAAAAARRTRTLAQEGIVAGARAEEAEARAAQARAMVNERQRLMSVAGGSGARPGEYVLRAPIAGKVAQLDLQPGGALEAMAMAAVIDRDDRLWLEARLPPALMGQVVVGAPVRVGQAEGKVIAVGSSIDPRTRSVVLRAEIGTGSGLVPGRTTNMTVMGKAPAGAVGAPKSALTQLGGRDVVFVRGPQGYVAQPVTVIGAAGDRAVLTGLSAGTRVVTSGVIQLKSALGR